MTRSSFPEMAVWDGAAKPFALSVETAADALVMKSCILADVVSGKLPSSSHHADDNQHVLDLEGYAVVGRGNERNVGDCYELMAFAGGSLMDGDAFNVLDFVVGMKFQYRLTSLNALRYFYITHVHEEDITFNLRIWLRMLYTRHHPKTTRPLVIKYTDITRYMCVYDAIHVPNHSSNGRRLP
ncbi:hypothetical protein M422DRAFT_267373 [Sphaerobolus stellatus SS14]|uniref:Uncharacterized protein n=1 Tax=Sphaerobolus stellatus (strain SS14) TaxID=990650 RepID=A0A0C9TM66_SPHS4|nr:hypothetical protein M422DRAFT_267373 [Sphaerobolus stellatus SS14]